MNNRQSRKMVEAGGRGGCTAGLDFGNSGRAGTMALEAKPTARPFKLIRY